MTYDEVIKFYGSNYRISKEVGFATHTPANWKKSGRIPASSQIAIEKQSKGALKYNYEHTKSPTPELMDEIKRLVFESENKIKQIRLSVKSLERGLISFDDHISKVSFASILCIWDYIENKLAKDMEKIFGKD